MQHTTYGYVAMSPGKMKICGAPHARGVAGWLGGVLYIAGGLMAGKMTATSGEPSEQLGSWGRGGGLTNSAPSITSRLGRSSDHWQAAAIACPRHRLRARASTSECLLRPAEHPVRHLHPDHPKAIK